MSIQDFLHPPISALEVSSSTDRAANQQIASAQSMISQAHYRTALQNYQQQEAHIKDPSSAPHAKDVWGMPTDGMQSHTTTLLIHSCFLLLMHLLFGY